tara:strand:- start:526 stop:762 length:237 start_codon:yes stop_codon:yes gene_type:complete
MAGMFNNDFSWDSGQIFDNIGNPDKRKEYLEDLSGTGNNKRELKKQIKQLDESEMKQVLYQLPEEGKEEFVKMFYDLD